MKYSKEKIKECADWIEQYGLQEHGGAKLKEFCQAVSISQETYFQWMKQTEFSEAIKKAKEVFRSSLEKRIVNSLANSAIGYETTETKTEYASDLLTGKPKIKKQTKTTKQVPPNTGAAVFLLTNLAPERWKNKLNTEHTGEVDTGMTFIIESEKDKELIEKMVGR